MLYCSYRKIYTSIHHRKTFHKGGDKRVARWKVQFYDTNTKTNNNFTEMESKMRTKIIIALLVISGFFVHGLIASGNTEGSGAAEKKAEKEIIGVDGYCPVCAFNGSLVKGKKEFSSKYEGKTYYFPNAETKTKFDAEPAKYTKDIEATIKKLVEAKKDEGSNKSEHPK
jgi:YHS domain-containing protein